MIGILDQLQIKMVDLSIQSILYVEKNRSCKGNKFV